MCSLKLLWKVFHRQQGRAARGLAPGLRPHLVTAPAAPYDDGVDWDPIDPLIRMALDEDLGAEGDVTSLAIFTDEQRRCLLVSKDTGVLAGAAVFSRVFAAVDPASRVRFLAEDGASLVPGQTVAEVDGRAISVLSSERVALNFLCLPLGHRHAGEGVRRGRRRQE